MGAVSADIEASAQDMPVSVVATVESDEIVVDADAIGHIDNQAQSQQVNIPVSNENAAPSLFNDVETPELTDFLTFLEKPRDRKPEISSEISKEPEIQYDRVPPTHQPEEQLEKSELPVKI